MKKLTLALLALCVVLSITFTSCIIDDFTRPDKSMRDCVNATTWVPVSVTKDGISVLSDFTAFKITFGVTATAGQMITGPTNPETKTVTYNVTESTIIVMGGLTGWATTLVTASTNGNYCTELKFTVSITNSTTGAADYAFVLQRQ